MCMNYVITRVVHWAAWHRVLLSGRATDQRMKAKKKIKIKIKTEHGNKTKDKKQHNGTKRRELNKHYI